jgi:copper chaperone
MAIQTFKTTINCGNCVRAVTPDLNAEPGIQSWRVDTASPDKLLTISGEISAVRVKELLAEIGFEAEPVR